MGEVIEAAVKLGLLTDEQPSLDLFDLDYFRSRIRSLKEAFPETFFNHAAAVKANPIRCILEECRLAGMGAECASLQEAKLALEMGFQPGLIVYDSPVKTPTELAEAVRLGLYMNLDNEHEIAILDPLLRRDPNPAGVVGLRINPVVGAGQIAMISTATPQSKFGLPFTTDTRQRLLELIQVHSWIRGLHIHVGSHGVPMDKFVAGAVVLMELVEELEVLCPGQIQVIDIGGGLSTSYTEPGEPEDFSYALYREQLQKKVPRLFSGRYKVVTEMGRSLFLKAGTSITRVEHVKDWIPGQNPILLTYLGTNQFPREAYLPHIWRHRFSVYNNEGKRKAGEPVLVDIGGPMCFQGDYLARDVSLPLPKSGDIVAIHDTGAYTMAMYCKFNSIRASPVYGYERKQADGGWRFHCFKPRETVQECLAFWGPARPTAVLE